MSAGTRADAFCNVVYDESMHTPDVSMGVFKETGNGNKSERGYLVRQIKKKGRLGQISKFDPCFGSSITWSKCDSKVLLFNEYASKKKEQCQ